MRETHYISADMLTFVGDSHFNDATPSTRIDDYSAASLDKLDKLFSIVSSHPRPIIFLGDVFHKRKQSLSYISSLMAKFRRFRDEGCPVYAVIGNHDLAYERMDTVETGPLGVFFQSGIIEPLRNLVITTPGDYRVLVAGFHYPEDILPAKELVEGEVFAVCVAHRYYDYDFDDQTLRESHLIDLGYRVYAFGHDHCNYPVTKVGSSVLIRPGSFMRGTSNRYNLEREVCVETLTLRGDRRKPQVGISHEEIPIRPAQEVFSATVFDKSSTLSAIALGISERVDDLLHRIEVGAEGVGSVYTVLDSLQIKPEVKKRIESALSSQGVFRKNV
jgi:hypothetical protein